ncbi:MAG: HDOD domain-containing protein [bacterium]
MSVDRIKARIMTVMRNLPPLPAVTRQLLLTIADENASAGDVSRVLSSDQALAGKVLKLVNSSFYGVQQEVTTISRAVVMLGFTGIRNLAMGFGSVSAMQSLGGSLKMEGFWAHALATGAAAQTLAPHCSRRTDPEEAFLAGLMHDIGAYVLAAAIPEIYFEVLRNPDGDRLQAEMELCGMTHGQVGQSLLKFWELPEAFCDAARHHHDVARATDGTQPLTNLVALADVLACVHGGAFETPATEEEVSRLLATSGIGREHVLLALRGMDQKVQDMSSFLHIAGADLSDGRVAKDAETTTCVIVTTDANRRDWVSLLLEYMGQDLFPMESYFNQAPGSAEVGLVLVDPQCMTSQKFDQLMVFLSSLSARVCVLAERDGHLPANTRELPRLDFVFTRSDLGRILAGQPV